MWIVLAVVIVAVVAIFVVGRRGESELAPEVEAIDSAGLHLSDEVIEWHDLYEVIVIARRSLTGGWFGFEVRSGGSRVVRIEGPRHGLGEAFLAESHRLAGFDHTAVAEVLGQRNGRALCYRR